MKEDINILKPKKREELLSDIKKLTFDQKLDIIEELWNEDWGEFVLDISRYLGEWKFGDIISELIIMKQEEYNES